MDNTQKKRMVGALVLGVFLLLALPVLFTGQGRLPVARITDIPPVPAMPAPTAGALDPAAQAEARALLERRVDELLGVPEDAESSPSTSSPASPPQAALEPSSAEERSSEAATSITSVPRTDAPVAHAESGEIVAWSVQMGSFRQADNARRLLEQLRTAGYEAYTKQSVLSDGSVLTQVMVGPDVDQERARQRKDILAEEFGLPTLVVRFQP